MGSRHPSGLGDMVTLSLSTTIGQFFTILLSTVLFLHPLSLGQWAGTIIVFGTLYYKVFAGKKGTNSTPQSPGKNGLPVSVRGSSITMPDLSNDVKTEGSPR